MKGARAVAAVLCLIAGAAWAGEAEDRKARSIHVLEAQGVPHIEHLPVIETEGASLRRSRAEVVERAIALLVVSVKGETRDQALAQGIVEQFGAGAFLSPRESAYIADPDPAEQDHIDAVWRYESAYVMLWALGFFDELSRPGQIADVPAMAELARELGTDGLMREAKLRPQAELLDAADLAYRYHWASVDARVGNTKVPGWMIPSVTYERLYALNWLIGAYGGQDTPWDDVPTDT